MFFQDLSTRPGFITYPPLPPCTSLQKKAKISILCLQSPVLSSILHILEQSKNSKSSFTHSVFKPPWLHKHCETLMKEICNASFIKKQLQRETLGRQLPLTWESVWLHHWYFVHLLYEKASPGQQMPWGCSKLQHFMLPDPSNFASVCFCLPGSKAELLGVCVRCLC